MKREPRRFVNEGKKQRGERSNQRKTAPKELFRRQADRSSCMVNETECDSLWEVTWPYETQTTDYIL